jgi:protein-L-isoaspartate(D-aspartate) O-methyltransferase
MTSQRARDRLVDRLRAEGIKDERVLVALRTLPRHLFIDEALASRAYEDTALPIGNGQTISQPWVVARMTEALIEHGMPKKVLEIGTGSGYQAAVLATLGIEVYTVERIDELLRLARKRFRGMGMTLRTKHDDGRLGWPEHAPFDAIIVTAAGAALDEALVGQLAEGGTLVAPVGPANAAQALLRIRKTHEGVLRENLGAVVFVPLLPGTT